VLDLRFDLSCGNVSHIKREVEQADLGVDCSTHGLLARDKEERRRAGEREEGEEETAKVRSMRRWLESKLEHLQPGNTS
jgi:hypothetical protein